MQTSREKLIIAMICDVGLDPITVARRMESFDGCEGSLNLVLSRDRAEKLHVALTGTEEDINVRLSNPSQSGMVVVDIEKITHIESREPLL